MWAQSEARTSDVGARSYSGVPSYFKGNIEDARMYAATTPTCAMLYSAGPQSRYEEPSRRRSEARTSETPQFHPAAARCSAVAKKNGTFEHQLAYPVPNPV